MRRFCEAVEDYGKQYGMRRTYGCFVLFDDKLSGLVSPKSNDEFAECANIFNAQNRGFIGGATSGDIIKMRFSVGNSVFDVHHTDWFIGGATMEELQRFMGIVFPNYGLVGKGKAIIVDRQTGTTVSTTDGKLFKPVSGIDRYLSFHHSTEGKGGYIYYTDVVDNMEKIQDPQTFGQRLYNFKVWLRNFTLTGLGKTLHGIKLWNIRRGNKITDYTKDGGLLGKFLNEHGKIDDADSILLSLPGATSEQLLMIGTDLCRKFHQTSVVVEDLNKNLCYFANGKKFAGKTKEERKANAARNLDANARFLNNDREPNEEELNGLNAGTIDEAVDELCRLAGC